MIAVEEIYCMTTKSICIDYQVRIHYTIAAWLHLLFLDVDRGSGGIEVLNS